MGVESEHHLATTVPVHDQTHGAVAVFDRKREIAFLVGTAHPLVLRGGNGSLPHQAFGAATNTGEECFHQEPVTELGGTALSRLWCHTP